MPEVTYRQAVRAYRDAWRQIDRRDPEVQRWARFYLDANEWCETVAAEYRISPHSVASIVALVSPRMPWGRNKIVARRIVAALAQSDGGWPTRMEDVKEILDAIPRLGITHERRRAVARYVAGDEWNDKALKVTAFRANLTGDLYPVTVDTWMAKPFGLKSLTPKQYATLARAVTQVSREGYGPAPAVVQAILWGYFRQGSGWAKHDNGDEQLRLEVTA